MPVRPSGLQTARIARQVRAYTGLVNKESHIVDDQKLFTTVKRPTYLKRKSDGPLFTAMMLGLVFGFVQSFRGEMSMATGTNKKE
ncbi:hypothetical protein CCR75_008478 [Bremia lactucae]|uniref:Uncharacterized protein n=1 Tax=Bremia lactucae TaxID=4779 RepID=A0A976NYB8_BRELC|nr:hypothetical protein CCR75_004867 [Bremia lactucae]TDH72659.1 hypothetical protein CCR75_008478 [Bremia lactucae]